MGINDGEDTEDVDNDAVCCCIRTSMACRNDSRITASSKSHTRKPKSLLSTEVYNLHAIVEGMTNDNEKQ